MSLREPFSAFFLQNSLEGHRQRDRADPGRPQRQDRWCLVWRGWSGYNKRTKCAPYWHLPPHSHVFRPPASLEHLPSPLRFFSLPFLLHALSCSLDHQASSLCCQCQPSSPALGFSAPSALRLLLSPARPSPLWSAHPLMTPLHCLPGPPGPRPPM